MPKLSPVLSYVMNIVRRGKIVIAREVTINRKISSIINMRGKQINSRIDNCQHQVNNIEIRKIIYEVRPANSKGREGEIDMELIK